MYNLPEYLKKYSTINSKFIDDFFGLHDYKIISDKIYIDFTLVTKWLQSRKDTLKKTLVNSYIKDVDYKIVKGKSTGGRPVENITLSYNCFRRLCMMSHTEKAEEVRSYFIDVEKHLDKYKDYIIEALDNKVGVLKKNQKPKINTHSGVIYVLKTDLDIEGVYKIGKTKSWNDRIKTHNSSHVDDVDVMLIFETEDIDTVEKCLKLMLKTYTYRKRKEFYEVDINIIKKLIDGCEKLTLLAKNKATQKNKK